MLVLWLAAASAQEIDPFSEAEKSEPSDHPLDYKGGWMHIGVLHRVVHGGSSTFTYVEPDEESDAYDPDEIALAAKYEDVEDSLDGYGMGLQSTAVVLGYAGQTSLFFAGIDLAFGGTAARGTASGSAGDVDLSGSVTFVMWGCGGIRPDLGTLSPYLAVKGGFGLDGLQVRTDDGDFAILSAPVLYGPQAGLQIDFGESGMFDVGGLWLPGPFQSGFGVQASVGLRTGKSEVLK